MFRTCCLSMVPYRVPSLIRCLPFRFRYDKVIIACGSVSNDHGVPGLENCHQLKTIEDSRKIRSHILTNLELAALPSTSAEMRKKLMSFVVCGGGPTGVEFAAELFDMISEDVMG